jgi:hypothetical protein
VAVGRPEDSAVVGHAEAGEAHGEPDRGSGGDRSTPEGLARNLDRRIEVDDAGAVGSV